MPTRFTKNRQLVLVYLQQKTQPLDAMTLWMEMLNKGIDIGYSSVYSSLSWLVENKFVQKFSGEKMNTYLAMVNENSIYK